MKSKCLLNFLSLIVCSTNVSANMYFKAKGVGQLFHGLNDEKAKVENNNIVKEHIQILDLRS